MLCINVFGEIYFGMRACVIGFGNFFAAYYRGLCKFLFTLGNDVVSLPVYK